MHAPRQSAGMRLWDAGMSALMHLALRSGVDVMTAADMTRSHRADRLLKASLTACRRGGFWCGSKSHRPVGRKGEIHMGQGACSSCTQPAGRVEG